MCRQGARASSVLQLAVLCVPTAASCHSSAALPSCLLLLLLLLGATLGSGIHQQRRLRLLGMLHLKVAQKKSRVPMGQGCSTASVLRCPMLESHAMGLLKPACTAATLRALSPGPPCPRLPAGPWLLCSRAACRQLETGSCQRGIRRTAASEPDPMIPPGMPPGTGSRGAQEEQQRQARPR